ncbi:hypothetical protein BHECKSOX_880, partial [Bathymodiolus heckerae thiotrophic gill symbiont]|uniref:hypothetical protein n=1 Tax=Bathymodiolus heckerae thiotrophic gill symbiont TaxID=1052212 RepID=UPI0010B20E87
MNLKKILVSSLLLAGIAISPYALADQSFGGHTINAAFGKWDSNDAVNGGDVFFYITREKDVLASDLVYPDEKDFYVIDRFSYYFDWDIDFNENRIELTYVSIKADDMYHQYIYTWSKGFRFRDSENSLPDIINVSVDSTFAPLGFDPELVTFDANNIYVNLKDSRCLWSKIPVEGSNDLVSECVNLLSPTGFNNRISLQVTFAHGEEVDKETIDEPTIDTCPAIDEPVNDVVIIDKETIDELYVWAESKFPEYFPSHQ